MIRSENRLFTLPKNKTGLFAADTLHDARVTRHHLNTVPSLSPQYRANGTINNLLASAEQNHHQYQQYLLSSQEIQQYYPLNGASGTAIDTSNSSRPTSKGIRNGFRPSVVRHPNFRFASASTQRISDVKDQSSKSSFTPSHGSVRLRSEIDQINNQVRKHEDASKRELDRTIQSAMSFSTTCRMSSASSIHNADRVHQRFSSAITQVSANVALETKDEVLEKIEPILTDPVPPPTTAVNEMVFQPDETPKHAYQIPQQSNVGSETVFSYTTPASHSSRARSVRSHQGRRNSSRTVSCPFYVMYLANLAIQQQRNVKEPHPTPTDDQEAIPLTFQSTTRKVPVNSRTSTAFTGRHSSRRPVNSPLSIQTFSTVDDDDHATLTSHSTSKKRPSVKTLSVDNEKMGTLADILRTSSWPHLQP